MGLINPVGALAGAPGIVGKPVAAFVGSTSDPSASIGYLLGGGGVSCITQLRKWTRRAFIVSVCGTGLAANAPRPKFGPGHAGAAAGTTLKPPLPPPCCVLGM